MKEGRDERSDDRPSKRSRRDRSRSRSRSPTTSKRSTDAENNGKNSAIEMATAKAAEISKHIQGQEKVRIEITIFLSCLVINLLAESDDEFLWQSD
jgi:hypothetical protein